MADLAKKRKRAAAKYIDDDSDDDFSTGTPPPPPISDKVSTQKSSKQKKKEHNTLASTQIESGRHGRPSNRLSKEEMQFQKELEEALRLSANDLVIPVNTDFNSEKADRQSGKDQKKFEESNDVSKDDRLEAPSTGKNVNETNPKGPDLAADDDFVDVTAKTSASTDEEDAEKPPHTILVEAMVHQSSFQDNTSENPTKPLVVNCRKVKDDSEKKKSGQKSKKESWEVVSSKSPSNKKQWQQRELTTDPEQIEVSEVINERDVSENEQDGMPRKRRRSAVTKYCQSSSSESEAEEDPFASVVKAKSRKSKGESKNTKKIEKASESDEDKENDDLSFEEESEASEQQEGSDFEEEFASKKQKKKSSLNNKSGRTDKKEKNKSKSANQVPTKDKMKDTKSSLKPKQQAKVKPTDDKLTGNSPPGVHLQESKDAKESSPMAMSTSCRTSLASSTVAKGSPIASGLKKSAASTSLSPGITKLELSTSRGPATPPSGGGRSLGPGGSSLTKVKIPAWVPPARVGNSSPGVSNSSGTLMSPAIGLRVGLSRNIRVSKPLHTSVKHVD